MEKLVIYFLVLEWAAQSLPGHRCPEMCQFAVHSSLPGGSWWSGHRCSFLGDVAPDQFPKAVPRPWEPAAGIPPPEHLPSVSTAAAAEWEHCSSNACSYTDSPISSSSPGLAQDLGRQEDDGEKLHKHAKREKISIQGQQKERRLDVGGGINRYAWSRKGHEGL